MEDIAIVVGVTSVALLIVLLIGWTIWAVSLRGRQRLHGQLELQRQTLERFSSADELVAFIQTETGRRFIDSLATEHASYAQRILASTRIGVVLVLVGAGLCLLPLFEGDLRPLAFFGVMGIVLGLGFLISAWVSYRLARSWGLLPPTG